MQIFSRLFGSHSVNLERALDRTTHRANLLTKNLSNVNTPGYKRVDTDFGITLENRTGQIGQLSGQVKKGVHAPARLTVADVRNRGPLSERIGVHRQRLNENPVRTDYGSVRTDGSSVDLETEVMSVTETQLRYEMLAEMTNRYFSGLKNVIREGR